MDYSQGCGPLLQAWPQSGRVWVGGQLICLSCRCFSLPFHSPENCVKNILGCGLKKKKIDRSLDENSEIRNEERGLGAVFVPWLLLPLKDQMGLQEDRVSGRDFDCLESG